VASRIINQIRNPPLPAASTGVHALAKHLASEYGENLQAILYYGSCLRSGDDREGIVDLYALVGSYRAAYKGRGLALLNKLLPPNVFYLEIPYRNRRVRAKYAVLSMSDFRKGTGPAWFHSYLWGRFAQPVGLLYCRDERTDQLVYESLSQAVNTFLLRVLPQLRQPFDARELWSKGLLLSYRAELRSEKPAAILRLYDAAADYYERVTRDALASLSLPVDILESDGRPCYRVHFSDRSRIANTWAWKLRGLQGKVLSVLRLLKGWATFQGGTEYILWKIERHSGVKIDLTPRLKKHPFVALWVISWRLYRRGGFR
jgi:hypothetical protein